MTIAPDGLYQYGGVPVGGVIALGMGHVYYVMQAANDNYDEFAAAHTKRYQDDGSDMLHNTIQSALDVTKTLRNDYVIVMPDSSDYDLTTTLTMTKDCVHLICPAGLSSIGANNACRVDQNTADTAHITVTGKAIEIAGFWFKTTGAQTHTSTSGLICCPTAATGYAVEIHHNYFFRSLSGSDNAPSINAYNAGSFNYHNIHHNKFIHVTPATTLAYGVYISSSNGNFVYNDMLVQNGAAITVGVRMNGAGGIVSYNNFYASIAGGGLSAGTFGACIALESSETLSCIGNRGAVGTGTMIQGGTADTTWCDNKSAVNGGVLCVDQDIDA